MVLNFSNILSQLFGRKVPLIVALFVALSISLLCYDPWVNKIVFSLGYRLRSRVALGLGFVISNHLL